MIRAYCSLLAAGGLAAFGASLLVAAYASQQLDQALVYLRKSGALLDRARALVMLQHRPPQNDQPLRASELAAQLEQFVATYGDGPVALAALESFEDVVLADVGQFADRSQGRFVALYTDRALMVAVDEDKTITREIDEIGRNLGLCGGGL